MNSRSFSLVEAVVAIAFVAVLAIAIGATLQTVGRETSFNAGQERLERALSTVLLELERDLRRASFASITLKDVDPSFGAKEIEIRLANGLDAASATAVLSPDPVSFKADGQGRFFRIQGSQRITIAALGSNDAPAFSFVKNDTDKSVEFTVRVRAHDSRTGEPITRERSSTIKVINP